MVSYASNEVVALIPARGGSKGIPRKNIKLFAGAPLIAWSIAAAKESPLVTRVIVSTDDPEIAEIAQTWGAEVPFLRPAELAQDDTPDLPVFLHLLDYLAKTTGHLPEAMLQLRPTSPIRPQGLVEQALALLKSDHSADSVRGVVPSGQNPYKMWHIDPKDGFMHPLLKLDGVKEPYNAPRQSLPSSFWQTGHIDAIRTRCIVEKSSLTGDYILPLHIDPRYTVDIDTPADWPKYEALVQDETLNLIDPLAQTRSRKKRPLPPRVRLLAFDFDGVFSDDMVFVDQDEPLKQYALQAAAMAWALECSRSRASPRWSSSLVKAIQLSRRVPKNWALPSSSRLWIKPKPCAISSSPEVIALKKLSLSATTSPIWLLFLKWLALSALQMPTPVVPTG